MLASERWKKRITLHGWVLLSLALLSACSTVPQREYSTVYVCFQDGILTTWQDFR